MTEQSVGSDANPLSCCLFHPRKSCEKHRKCSHTNVSNASVIRFSTPPAQTATFAFASESGYTLGFRRRIAHSGPHAETGAFRTGPLSLPSERSACSQTSPGRVSERRTLPLSGLGRGHSRRTQRAFGTAIRLCASLFRGAEALPGCVIFFASVEIGICTSGTHGFLRVRGRGGITTLSALYVLLKRRTAACQSGLFAVSLCPLFTFVKDPAGHCQYPH